MKLSQVTRMKATMHLIHIEGTVTGPTGEHITLQFFVDSGVNYTVLPLEVWLKLGLVPKVAQFHCILVDGTAVDREMGECHIRLPQGDCSMPVILGEEGDKAILGWMTLEKLGVILNPYTRQLKPMQMTLA